jgi:hypothetical protein
MPFVSSIRGAYGIQGSIYGRYPFAVNTFSNSTSGGSITTAGGYRIHTFTTVGASTFSVVAGEVAGNGTRSPSGTLNVIGPWSGNVEYLVIGGGGSGGGGTGGGGGAGGYRTGTLSASAGNISVVVGTGGSGTTSLGTDGQSSTFGSITSAGGGGGSSDGGQGPSGPGKNGGSGGGGNQYSGVKTAGSGNVPSVSPSQGNPGFLGDQAGGGGGGAGGPGVLIAGGPGVSNSITGTPVVYSRGGGSSAAHTGIAEPGNSGYGSPGEYPHAPPASVPAGSGIVVVRYLI